MDTILTFCAELPSSVILDLGVDPCSGGSGSSVVAGELTAPINVLLESAAQCGEQGDINGTVPNPNVVLSGEYDSNVWRGSRIPVCTKTELAKKLRTFVNSSWVAPDEYTRLRKNIIWQNGEDVSIPVKTSFTALLQKLFDIRILQTTGEQRDIQTTGSADIATPYNFCIDVLFDEAMPIQETLTSAYVSCWPKREFVCNSFVACGGAHSEYVGVFRNNAAQQTQLCCLQWEDTKLPQLIWPIPVPYVPPVDDKFHGDLNLNLKCALPAPIWGSIKFNMGVPNVCDTAGVEIIIPEVVIVAHDLWIKLISTGEMLPCASISVTADRDAWGWSWSATLLQRQDSLVTSQQTVEINIDGNVWKGIVEQYSGSLSNQKQQYNIGGRSLAAELHSPYVSPRSRNETSIRTFKQLIIDEVVGTGWTIEWSPTITDFTIPANTFSYSNKTPMTAIKDIASAIGATVLAHPLEKKLIIRPKYLVPPWELTSATPNLTVARGYVLSESITWNPKALSRGVWVSGVSTGGVRGNIYRIGTDGAPYAPMVVDPLITEMAAAIQRGRQILSATGKRKDVSLRVPLLPMVGITYPGDIMLFEDTTDWMGYVDSISIAGTYSKVIQELTVEHIEEF